MNKTVRQVALPIITAFIWGSAFIAQGMVTDSIGTFTFNAARSIIAVVLLFGLCLILDFNRKRKAKLSGVEAEKTDLKSLIIGGTICGVLLFVASNLQQYAIQGNLDGSNSEGIVAFITAFYMILVPIIGIFSGKKNGLNVWISALIGLVGLYFVCVDKSLTINIYNLSALGCAVTFAFHIIVVDKYSQKVDCIKLSCMQFLVNLLLSGVSALIFETIDLAAIGESILPVLYVGVFSSTIAYTLQIVAQKGTNPTIVSVLLCLESVFALLVQTVMTLISGSENFLSTMQYVGCGIMFLAVVLTQIDFRAIFKKRT